MMCSVVIIYTSVYSIHSMFWWTSISTQTGSSSFRNGGRHHHPGYVLLVLASSLTSVKSQSGGQIDNQGRRADNESLFVHLWRKIILISHILSRSLIGFLTIDQFQDSQGFTIPNYRGRWDNALIATSLLRILQGSLFTSKKIIILIIILHLQY